MRYYSTQRPVSPGTFPQPAGNKVTEVHNFDCRTFCEEIGREAWGYIDYEQPLDTEQAIDYELYPAPRKVKPVKLLGTDSWGREVYKDKAGKLWKYTEPGPMPRERHDRLFSSTGNAFDGEPCWPMVPEVDYRIQEDPHDKA